MSYRACTVLRTFVRSHWTLNIATGVHDITRRETVTEPCNVPLFGNDNRAAGICSSCARGWEVDDNKFATLGERARATAK